MFEKALETAAYQETVACLVARKAGKVGGCLLHMTHSIVEGVTEVDCTALPVMYLRCHEHRSAHKVCSDSLYHECNSTGRQS